MISLIVGLGNPGSRYASTRHNVGFWFIEALAKSMHLRLRREAKLQSDLVSAEIAGQSCLLAMPTTFMNHSGQAVRAVAQYYKIPSNAILVVHDELDIDVGHAKIKFAGGHAGHNGLRDIIEQLGGNEFWRLRIGVGKPSHAKSGIDYVLGHPSGEEQIQIDTILQKAMDILPLLVSGQQDKAMQLLHSSSVTIHKEDEK